MKITIIIITLIILSIPLSILRYPMFLNLLAILWYIVSVLIIYLAIILTKKYHLEQLKINKLIKSIKSKSNNNITPITSLNMSLGAKIGIGSLSGIALSIYYGGVGTIFWLIIISMFISINTYAECILGIKYRIKKDKKYLGGPSYYIEKCLNNKYLSILYSTLIILTYSGLFLSIQANTISTVITNFNININYVSFFLVILTYIIITKGITRFNNLIVPFMLLIYLILGMYIFIININLLPNIIINIIKEAFKLKSIISTILIGIERAIFITESSLGTSAISASTCDNIPEKQASLEVLGIYITIFIICLTTFIIIVTSDYQTLIFNNLNGIELLIHAFKYHFGDIGPIILSIITIMFAFSTITSSYFFGKNNIKNITNKKTLIYKLSFLFIIAISCYLKATYLWNLTDFYVAIISLINVYSLIKIYQNKIV